MPCAYTVALAQRVERQLHGLPVGVDVQEQVEVPPADVTR